MDRDTQEITPSTCTDEWWIWCECRPGMAESERPYTENSGKWMIFRDTGPAIDEAWRIVKQATEDGRLGRGSKVSTLRTKNRDKNRNKSFVICVYTYDYTDEQHVFRVRQALRELGFTEKLSYKSDRATLANQYSYNTPGRVSMWRE